MIVILLFCIVAIVIFVLAALKQTDTHKKSIEAFNEEMYYDLTEREKEVYYDIIEIFKEVLSRHPTIDELFGEFKNIKYGYNTLSELREKLIKGTEYVNLSQGSDFMSQQAPIIDHVVSVEEKKDEEDKEVGEEDEEVGEEDEESLEEVKPNTTITNNEEVIIADAVSPLDATQKPLPFEITRPDINNRRSLVIHTVVDQKNKCKHLQLAVNNSQHLLAKLQHERNMDEMKFHCSKEK